MSRLKLLNIGCGGRFHPDWINLDVAPADGTVLRVDIGRGLPFPPHFADACYSSHVLEHLDRAGAQNLVQDCFRILKAGGTIRLVTPDLETIAQEYLRILQSVGSGVAAQQSDYEWIMLELYDQTVRETPGGAMAPFLSALDVSDRDFVRSRIGYEAEMFWSHESTYSARTNLRMMVKRWRELLFRARMKVAEVVVHLIAGRDAASNFRVGVFRGRGEIHRWMYDRHSLTRLLEQNGFVDAKICGVGESRIPEFAKYSLELTNGVARKPDSVYVEASKP